MYHKLIHEGNIVYEIDEECLRQKEEKKRKKEKEISSGYDNKEKKG
ncbi:MAG: hypothetical protein PUB22_07805 [Clostridiales bacterium]|nr:hypothetical protein [Clostridiales bacterium]